MLLELVESNAMRRLWRGRYGRGLCISQLKGGAKPKCLAFQKWSDKNLKHGQQQMDMDEATPQRIKGGRGKQKLLYNCILMQQQQHQRFH